MLLAGILYHDMYASDLVGTHVEMRSLEVLMAHIFLAALHGGADAYTKTVGTCLPSFVCSLLADAHHSKAHTVCIQHACSF